MVKKEKGWRTALSQGEKWPRSSAEEAEGPSTSIRGYHEKENRGEV